MIMFITLLRIALRCLPTKLADKVYFHLLRNRAVQFEDAFKEAPLRPCRALRMNLNPSDTGHGHLAFTGVYEPDLTALFIQLSKQGGLLVDVGANYGYYSLLWCGLGAKNRSVAFEASPRVLPKLHENIVMNRLMDQIDLKEVAASNAAGVISFDVGPPDQTGWGGISSGQPGEGVVEVPAVRLDVAVDAPMITLLKIDCEGADYLVLQGAEGLLREKRIKHICFEENPLRMEKLGIEPGSAARYVKSLGYQCEPFGDGDSASEYHAWF